MTVTVTPKNPLVIYSSKNSRGKHDSSGAFTPMAELFQKVHNVPVNNMWPMDCRKQSVPERLQDFAMALATVGRHELIDAIAIFCHGFVSGLQVGPKVNTLPDIMPYIYQFCSKEVIIALYACSTGGRYIHANNSLTCKGSFAWTLAQKMHAYGFYGWIDAHVTRGHATQNPHVRRFFMTESHSRNSCWVVDPQESLWPLWVKTLREKPTTALKFPFWREFDEDALCL